MKKAMVIEEEPVGWVWVHIAIFYLATCSVFFAAGVWAHDWVMGVLR